MQSASQGRWSAKQGGESRRPGWWLPIGIGVGSIALLATTALIVFPRLLNIPVAETSAQTESNRSDTDGSNDRSGSASKAADRTSSQKSNGDLVRIGTYPPGPRLPGMAEFVERDFIATLPRPISDYVEDVPPDMNMAPKILETLTPLSAELVVCYPEPLYPQSERTEIIRVGKQNSQRIERWYQDYQESGKLPEPGELRAFDNLFNDLHRLTHQTHCSFLWVQDYPRKNEFQSAKLFQRLVWLLHLRYLVRADSPEIDQSIADLEVVLRLNRLHDTYDMTTDGSIEWWNFNDYVYALLVPEIVSNNNLTESYVKRLLSALDNDADRDHANTAITIIRMKELVFLRSMYNIETNVYASDPLSSLSSTVDKAQRANMGYLAIPLSTITPDQIQSNRDAYNQEAESISRFFESGDYERISSVDAYLEQRNQIEAGQMEAFEAAIKSDADMFNRMNTLPWLSMMMRPASRQLVGLSTWAIARRRVAIATLAVRIGSLQNASDSESLPSLFRRLNIKESPIDPYSGQPLKTIQKDGKTLVYSIGSDRIDDQTVTKAESYHLPGDLFFEKRISQKN